MKSIFSKLSTLLLCGAVAMVGCTDYSDDIQDLEAKTTASIEQVKKDLSTLKAEVEATYATKEALAGVVAELEALEGDVAELEALVANKADKTELEAAKKDLQDKIDAAKNELNKKIDDAKSELQGNIDAAKTELNKKIDDAVAAVNDELTKINTRIGAAESQIDTLKSDVKGLSDKLDETAEDLQTKIDAANVKIDTLDARVGKLENAVTVLQGDVEELNNAVEDLRDDVNEMGNRLNELTALVNMTYSRVQSLVYVPKYSDGKATLDWAVVNPYGSTFQFPTILNKASDLKYLVKANTPKEAANAASAIAAAWKKVLDYAVEPVEIRTKAVEPADLEIVNVVASGDSIIVSVVAKNFETSFYEDPAEGIYSAALALKDENGANLTSEYTNLVPAKVPEKYEMALFVAEEDEELGEVSMNMVTEVNDTIPYLMPCNNDTTVYSAVKPVVGFVPAGIQPTNPASYLTEEDLTKQGYDVTVDMDILITDENYYRHDGTMDTKPGPIGIDNYFNIMGGDPVYDFHYTVKPGVDFENKGKYSIVTYEFTCGETVKTLSYRFELANAQIAINAEVDIKWTVALQESLIANGVQFGKALPFEVKEYTTVGGDVTNLWSALSQEKKSTSNYVMTAGTWVESKKIISNKSLTETKAVYQLAAEKYSWNNSYKVVFVTTNDDLNVDYTTTIVVNLKEKPAVINVPAIDVDLLLNGKASYFTADVDLFGASYAAIKEHLGYADAAADSTAWVAVFDTFKAQNVDPDCAVVNDKVGRASTLNNLAEVRLSIEEHNNGRYEILVDTTNVITYSAETWFGVPFNFKVNANVVLPKVGLIYSEDYVKDQNTNPYALAEAAIEDSVYSIIKSDLAKYFNVAAESLEGHAYTVNFEVLSPEGDVVSLAKNSTTVEPKGASTYHYLTAGVDLDWENYTGLEVNVKATLLVNGLALESRTLRIVAEDPLTLTVADFDVTRLHRENTIVNVYDHVVITSTEEPEKTNILTIADGNDFDATVKYAKKTYGVDLKLILDPQGVYYFNNSGDKVYVGSNKFDYKNGVLTIYGDDSVVKNYYAEFTAVMTSRICKGEHRESFRITIKK